MANLAVTLSAVMPHEFNARAYPEMKSPPFYDTHAHLGFPDFSAELPALIERAREAGIAKIICIGTDLQSSARAIQIAEEFPGVYAAVGCIQRMCSMRPMTCAPPCVIWPRHPKVVAIGETGLDYHRRPDGAGTEADFERYKARQAEIFRQQMEIAAEMG